MRPAGRERVQDAPVIARRPKNTKYIQPKQNIHTDKARLISPGAVIIFVAVGVLALEQRRRGE